MGNLALEKGLGESKGILKNASEQEIKRNSSNREGQSQGREVVLDDAWIWPWKKETIISPTYP